MKQIASLKKRNLFQERPFLKHANPFPLRRFWLTKAAPNSNGILSRRNGISLLLRRD